MTNPSTLYLVVIPGIGALLAACLFAYTWVADRRALHRADIAERHAADGQR